MFLVICSVFRMTSSVLGRMGLGAIRGSAVSGTEPSPCHTILLCLPFLLDLWILKKWLNATGVYQLLLCFYEPLHVHLLSAQVCCFCGFLYPVWQETHGKAVSSTGSHNSYGGFYSTIGLENMTPVERVKMEKGREKLEEGRCVIINPFLI